MSTQANTATATKWVLDPSHSELTFKVKHLMISNVKGLFKTFSAEIQGEDFLSAPVKVSIDAASVSTNDDGRDGHLRSADFFDVEQFPQISFESTALAKTGDDTYQLTGQLSIKGISKAVTLDAEFGGKNTDPWGNEKLAFSLDGKINRKDWGLNWNAALETGGVLVSEEVRISADVQFVKKS